ncbi:hypothetical protein ES703_97327 [subsurface metagenome]
MPNVHRFLDFLEKGGDKGMKKLCLILVVMLAIGITGYTVADDVNCKTGLRQKGLMMGNQKMWTLFFLPPEFIRSSKYALFH